MRLSRYTAFVFSSVLAVASLACGPELQSEGLGLDNDPPLADRDELLAGAPKADEIPVEFKADELLPAAFSELVDLQSPVKSQGSRGVCSIFASAALMEHLYISEGTISNPDFSEQYLQWSAKFEVGAFTNTAGSNNTFNLQAISQFGIPEEAAWAYEPSQWGAADDPACDGDDALPTRCYTNGQPPEEALDAQKFRLPPSRFLSRRDIKAHMLNRRTAVGVGFDFFYQSWNHRRSTLPTNPSYWDEGYVLYPNEDDKRVSLEKRAGHAILLVGWDDTLEVPIVDKDGDQVLDSDGEAIVERGFYIFKNSWGTAGFGIDNQFGAGYGYISQRYIHEFGSLRVTDLPVVERPEETCGNGADDDGNGDADCDDAACAGEAECQGGTAVTIDGEGNISIPDNSLTGISSLATDDQGGTIRQLTVDVSIEHTFRGDLRVSLHRGSEAVVLHDRTGGGADDLVESFEVGAFVGQDLAGEWRLVVVDMANQDVGTLTSWSLTAVVE